MKRMTLRLPDGLHASLKKLAQENSFSMHQYITLALIEHVYPGSILHIPEEEAPDLEEIHELQRLHRQGASDAELDAAVERFNAEKKAAQVTQEKQPDVSVTAT